MKMKIVLASLLMAASVSSFAEGCTSVVPPLTSSKSENGIQVTAFATCENGRTVISYNTGKVIVLDKEGKVISAVQPEK